MDNISNYFSYQKGTMPIIISAPHGGTIKMHKIPTRSSGIKGIDKGTAEIAQKIANEIENASILSFQEKMRPSFVIAKIHRSKIDFNRPPQKAFDASTPLAQKFYDFYHDQIKLFLRDNLRTFKFSILFDIHGFERNKRPEGYRDVDIVIGTRNLRSIADIPMKKADFDKNIRGRLLRHLLSLDIPMAPSHPKRKEYVLTGGFTTKNYGHQRFIGSEAIQIEFSERIRIEDKKLRNRVINSLTGFILDEYKSRFSI